MSDEDEPVAFATQEEAIAAAMAESEPGDIIEIHDVACQLQVDEDCNCDVLTIKVGEHKA